MKLKLEIQGIEINVEEIDGNIVIKAEQNGEVIDEMEVPVTAVENDEPAEDAEPMENGSDELPIEEPIDNEEAPIEELEEGIKSFDEFFKTK